jgi:UDP-3-O-[3-hydroxymyristoyl] glucosamine N-acyltransferase
MLITSEFIKGNISTVSELKKDCTFEHLGLVDTQKSNSLTFIDDINFLDELLANKNIRGVLISQVMVKLILRADIQIILSDDPRYDYYHLINKRGEATYKKYPSNISSSAKVHVSAYVSDYNVTIGENVIIEPNVTILSDVEIGSNSIIRAGAVLGSEGFEHKRTSKGVLSVWHDGKVIIGSNVEIGANTCIDKGFSTLSTTVGDYTKIDNLVHIAHGVQIGKSCFVIACSMIAGGVILKDNVWIGPNANIANKVVIENGGYVSIGSVVTRSVMSGQHVTGNFALPHDKFLSNLKRSLKD